MLHERQPETRPVGLRRVVRLEDPRALCLGHPGPVVVDHHAHAPLVGRRSHTHRASARNGFEGVLHEVPHDRAHLGGSRRDRQLAPEPRDESDLALAPEDLEPLEQIREHPAHVGPRRLRGRRRGRDGATTPRDPHRVEGVRGRALDASKQRVSLFCGRTRPERGEARDGGQPVRELVHQRRLRGIAAAARVATRSQEHPHAIVLVAPCRDAPRPRRFDHHVPHALRRDAIEQRRDRRGARGLSRDARNRVVDAPLEADPERRLRGVAERRRAARDLHDQGQVEVTRDPPVGLRGDSHPERVRPAELHQRVDHLVGDAELFRSCRGVTNREALSRPHRSGQGDEHFGFGNDHSGKISWQ
jgi:hypothetical protein